MRKSECNKIILFVAGALLPVPTWTNDNYDLTGHQVLCLMCHNQTENKTWHSLVLYIGSTSCSDENCDFCLLKYKLHAESSHKKMSDHIIENVYN